MTKEALTLALEAYIKAGIGNSTDFVLQNAAYDLAVEALAQPEQEPEDLTIAYMAGLSRGKELAPQRKPLTDEEMFELAEIAWRHGWASCRDAEYVGEEAEDERWGMVGAEVVQDIAAHGIKENT